MTNIFEYSNIFYANIYSYIRSCQKNSYEYIQTFVRVIFLTRIYSDIVRVKIHTNVTLWFRSNRIFDHCYQQNIHKQRVISREIKQKHRWNLFVSWKLIQTNIRIYSYQNFHTNKYPNKYLAKNYLNI